MPSIKPRRREDLPEFEDLWRRFEETTGYVPNSLLTLAHRPDILRAMATNGYLVSETENERGPIKVGLAADLIAVAGNPLDNIDALRNVQFVMKDGMVFKQNGVMTPEKFFHGGPVNGWNIR